VFIVVMENHDENEVWGTASTPYTTALAQANARAADYHAITHPSLPNYLDMYGGSNYGITNDCSPSSSCHISARNLADNLDAAGLSWKGYFESMPAPCSTSDSSGYIAHHNPFIYFDNIRTDAVRCATHVVNYAALSSDLATSATTPNFAFIVPNNCNNTHNCSIGIGDTWLSNNLPPILDSPACTVERCLLVLTWDENGGSPGNQVLTVFAGSAARSSYVSNATYDHFDLLRTVESVFGLPTQTANDAAATPMSDLLK
jgi:phosphatidylinositol-3-phosphatase